MVMDHGSYGITESVDSVCRDTTYTQYMLIQIIIRFSENNYYSIMILTTNIIIIIIART